MDHLNGHVMTLANSIIGVSLLAMPYCFKQCGIILSIIMLLTSSAMSRLACHFLMKSAIIARRKTFEFLAFYIFGAMGKFAIEIGIIGFLIGTCIAFFVVMGDLAPELISDITGTYTTNTMRTSILMALALFCVLPLGLLRNVDSLNGVSKATIGFYCCLVLNIIYEAVPHLFSGDWYSNVVFWRPAGIMQCLPIFSMALFCQTQLFEIYQALPNATLEKINGLVTTAVNICTSVYIFVGTFGYIAFSERPFGGNVLLSFSPSPVTHVMKVGFILSVAFSFPLVIFPCRASLYSLLYKKGYSVHEGTSNYIPEGKFKTITFIIVFISLIIGIMIPNIELVLGLVGSTIGVMICVLFPVTCFICISPKNTNERLLAQLMLMVGIFVMVLGTYENLYQIENRNIVDLDRVNLKEAVPTIIFNEKMLTTAKILNSGVNVQPSVAVTKKAKVEIEKPQIMEVRHEPPQPVAPAEEINQVKPVKSESSLKPVSEATVKKEKVIVKDIPPLDKKQDELTKENKSNSSAIPIKTDEVDVEAIKKEVIEEALQEEEKIKDNSNRVVIETIQKQNEVQKEIVEQQKKPLEAVKSQQEIKDETELNKINQEKLKAVKQIESIALKAIEKISGGDHKNNKEIVADAEIKLNQNVVETLNNQTAKVENTKDNGFDDKPQGLQPDQKISEEKILTIKNTLNQKTSGGKKENENVINYTDVVKEIKNTVAEIGIKNNITAPLLKKLGISNVDDNKTSLQNMIKGVPLPIVYSKAKIEEKDKVVLPVKETNKTLESKEKENAKKLQAIRRDVLSMTFGL